MTSNLERMAKDYDKSGNHRIARVLRDQAQEQLKLKEITKFSPEQREALETRGFLIIELTGQSIKTLRDMGNKFHTKWHRNHSEFEDKTSRLSEVAIIPGLFLPESNSKTFTQQEEMVEEFSNKLGIWGVSAIIGEAADYVDLAFAHFQATGERFFGENFNLIYTTTKTPTAHGRIAGVGRFSSEHGLNVTSWAPKSRYGHLSVAPLIVPDEVRIDQKLVA